MYTLVLTGHDQNSQELHAKLQELLCRELGVSQKAAALIFSRLPCALKKASSKEELAVLQRHITQCGGITQIAHSSDSAPNSAANNGNSSANNSELMSSYKKFQEKVSPNRPEQAEAPWPAQPQVAQSATIQMSSGQMTGIQESGLGNDRPANNSLDTCLTSELLDLDSSLEDLSKLLDSALGRTHAETAPTISPLPDQNSASATSTSDSNDSELLLLDDIETSPTPAAPTTSVSAISEHAATPAEQKPWDELTLSLDDPNDDPKGKPEHSPTIAAPVAKLETEKPQPLFVTEKIEIPITASDVEAPASNLASNPAHNNIDTIDNSLDTMMSSDATTRTESVPTAKSTPTAMHDVFKTSSSSAHRATAHEDSDATPVHKKRIATPKFQAIITAGAVSVVVMGMGLYNIVFSAEPNVNIDSLLAQQKTILGKKNEPELAIIPETVNERIFEYLGVSSDWNWNIKLTLSNDILTAFTVEVTQIPTPVLSNLEVARGIKRTPWISSIENLNAEKLSVPFSSQTRSSESDQEVKPDLQTSIPLRAYIEDDDGKNRIVCQLNIKATKESDSQIRLDWTAHTPDSEHDTRPRIKRTSNAKFEMYNSGVLMLKAKS